MVDSISRNEDKKGTEIKDDDDQIFILSQICHERQLIAKCTEFSWASKSHFAYIAHMFLYIATCFQTDSSFVGYKFRGNRTGT